MIEIVVQLLESRSGLVRFLFDFLEKIGRADLTAGPTVSAVMFHAHFLPASKARYKNHIACQGVGHPSEMPQETRDQNAMLQDIGSLLLDTRRDNQDAQGCSP